MEFCRRYSFPPFYFIIDPQHLGFGLFMYYEVSTFTIDFDFLIFTIGVAFNIGPDDDGPDDDTFVCP